MFRNPYTDTLVILLVVLLIFGPKRLPQLGKQLGQGIREFKDSITSRDEHDEIAERAQITPSATPVSPVSAAAEQHPAESEPTERRS